MPTHRTFPESEQGPVRFKNLVRELGSALQKKYGKRDETAQRLLEQVERLGSEGPDGDAIDFWNHQKDGLAVFAAPGFFAYYRVPIPLREIVVVSNSFHVKPLLRLLHVDARYHVLALTQGEVTLWDGNFDHIAPLAAKDIPHSLEEALGEELDTSRQGLSHHGGGGAGASRHGSGRPSDEAKKELRRFFREVDKKVEEGYSKPSGRPLILAAVDYYHPLFHEVSKNPLLFEQGIQHDPKSLSADQIRSAALEIIEPMREKNLAEALEAYGGAKAYHLGSNDIREIGSATVAGRVKLLLVEEARRLWGRVDRRTGEVAIGGQQGNPDDADVFDELAELTLLNGGDVRVVPHDRMPKGQGMAAIFRY
jgi:hypothetical protein